MVFYHGCATWLISYAKSNNHQKNFVRTTFNYHFIMAWSLISTAYHLVGNTVTFYSLSFLCWEKNVIFIGFLIIISN